MVGLMVTPPRGATMAFCWHPELLALWPVMQHHLSPQVTLKHSSVSQSLESGSGARIRLMFDL